MAKYFQESIETMSREELEAFQLECLKKQAVQCYENIDFYKKSFDEAGFDPHSIESLDDLRKMPFTLKQDLRDNYPYGMFGKPLEDAVEIHASSGTTGTATAVGYTPKDVEAWGDCFARGLISAGADTGSVVQVAYGYGLFTGGLGAHYGSHQLGSLVVPMSSGNTKRQVQILKDFGSEMLCCTPSYALLIADTAIEMGYTPSTEFPIKGCVLGAEPFSDSLRSEIEEKLGAKVIDIYGLSEVMGPGVAVECEYQEGLHVAEDQFIVEIIDPETLEPVPDGEYGEVVFTSIQRECSPLIRYRTRDISRIIPGECKCGRTHKRIDRLQGRTDDMLIIRGVNVFPRQIEEVITHFPELTAHYQIVLTTKNHLDRVELRVEAVEDFDFDEIRKIEQLKAAINQELKSNLQISVDLKIVEPKSIERSEGKAKRVIDMREGIK